MEHIEDPKCEQITEESLEGFDPELIAALQDSLQQIVKKAEKPMTKFHHRVLNFIVEIDHVIEQIIGENTKFEEKSVKLTQDNEKLRVENAKLTEQNTKLNDENARLKRQNGRLKEDNVALSTQHEKELTEWKQKNAELERDRSKWQTKAEHLDKTVENLNSVNSEHLLTITALKEERDKQKKEIAKRAMNNDLEQTKFEIKMHQLRKAHEDQTHELEKCQRSKRQLADKIRNVEKKLRDEKARLKREKKRWDCKVQKELAENSRLVAQQTEQQTVISSLEEKAQEQEATIKNVVDGLLANQLGNRLVTERISEMREMDTEMGSCGETSGMPPTPTKRKAAATDQVDETMLGEETKRLKVSNGKEGDGGGEATEEGEIVDQEAAQQDKPVISSSCSLLPTYSAGFLPSLNHHIPSSSRSRGNDCRRRAKSTHASRYHHRFYPQSHSKGAYKRSHR